MVKPVFKALSNIKAAETPDAARQLAIDFLKSDEARNVNNSQAGTFLTSLKAVFKDAPNHHEMVLRTVASPEVKVSADFKLFAGFELTDLGARAKYLQEAAPILFNNAKILSTFKGPEPTGFQFATHYGSAAAEPPHFAELDLSVVNNAADLKLAINRTLLENDITDDKAEVFLDAVKTAFRDLKISADDQVELLSFIQDGVGEDSKVFDLALEAASQVIEKNQGPAPRSANNGGRDCSPS